MVSRYHSEDEAKRVARLLAETRDQMNSGIEDID